MHVRLCVLCAHVCQIMWLFFWHTSLFVSGLVYSCRLYTTMLQQPITGGDGYVAFHWLCKRFCVNCCGVVCRLRNCAPAPLRHILSMSYRIIVWSMPKHPAALARQFVVSAKQLALYDLSFAAVHGRCVHRADRSHQPVPSINAWHNFIHVYIYLKIDVYLNLCTLLR
jgi:hypothetical protein